MPPQPTDVASDPGSVAERSYLDLSFLMTPVSRLWRSLAARWQPFGANVNLRDLRDRDLADIGLSREEIDQISPDRAVDRIRARAADLWSRGGM